jgi:hypothetical protein
MHAMEPSLLPSSNWLTAREIAERYIVGEQRLTAYSLQGNLPLRRSDDGTVRYDESVVSCLFRPRHGASPGLGVLGVVRLGEPPPDATAPPQSSRRLRQISPNLTRVEWTCVEGQRQAG